MRNGPYPDYRDSGVEWIGHIPTHWDMPPLYMRYEVELGKMLDEDRITGEYLVPYLRNVDVQWDRINFDDLPEMDVRPTEVGRYMVRNGDLLVCEGGDVGRAAVIPQGVGRIAFQKALHRLRPLREEHPRFFFYTLQFAAARGVFLAGGNPNTIIHLTGEMLRRYRFPHPPLDEQRAIAAFLDRETSRIDALVEKKRLLIERLEEQRTALISRTVTRGSSETARVHQSGVPAIGAIPEAWSVAPLHTLTKLYRPIIYGIVLPGPHVDDGVPIVKGGDVRERVSAGFVSSNTTFELDAEHARSRLIAGDLVFAIRGSVGEVAEVPFALHGANITQDTARISPKDDINPTWLRYFLSSKLTAAQVEANTLGATISGINIRDLRRVLVPVPPRREQDWIAVHLTLALGELETLRGRVREAIDRLQEYRTALITAAVTGKIDVRKSARDIAGVK